MAILKPQLTALAEVRSRKKGTMRMLSLGYPDLLVDTATMLDLFGAHIAEQLVYRPDSDQIIGWHGFTSRISKIAESDHFFSLIDIEAEYVDIARSRGIERIVDLNEPLPEDLIEKFDFVLDPGTIEHCCNIGQAMKSIASAVKPEGFVCHYSPLSMFNHGFYNVNPTLFVDFYAQNGFKIEFLAGAKGDRFDPDLVPLPATDRFDPEIGMSTLVVAKRLKVAQLRWPMQTKYLKNPDLKRGT